MPVSIGRHVIRHKGVTMNLMVPTPNIPRRAVILAYGLPGAPLTYSDSAVLKLAEAGFIVALPQYLGTFDSYGRCTIENSVDTLLYAIEILRRGKASDLYDLSTVRWRARSVSLVGGSFGGSVVLVAGAKSGQVRNIVALAPPVDYRTYAKDPEHEEEGFGEDKAIMRRAQPFTWRFSSDGTWKKAISGNIDLNAVDYIPQLRKRRTLLIHGWKDKSVSAEKTVSFHKLLGASRDHKLLILKRHGHFGLSALHNPRVFKEVVRWLKNC